VSNDDTEDPDAGTPISGASGLPIGGGPSPEIAPGDSAAGGGGADDTLSSGLNAQDLQRNAVKGTLWTVMHTIVAVVLGFGANIVVSRALGPVAFGRLALLSIVVSLASTAAGAGVGWGVTQWAVEAWSRSDREQAGSLIARSSGWRILVQLPVTVVVGIVLLHRAEPLVVVTFAAVTIVATSLDSALISLTISQRTSTGAKIALVASAVSQLAGVAVALNAPTASGVWVARYAAGVIGPLAAVAVLDPALRRSVLHPRLPRHMPIGFWRFALQFVGSNLLGLLVFNRSEVLVMDLYGQTRGVGVYALAYGVATHLIAPVDAAALPLIAGLGGLLATSPALVGNGLLRAERLVSLVSGLLLALVVPALVLVVPVIYGHAYQGVGLYLAVLAVVATMRGLKHPVDALLNARRRSNVLLWANVASFAVDAAVAFGAIAVVGVWGAVAATGASQMVAIVLQVQGEVRLGAVTWPGLLSSCRVWAIGVVGGTISLVIGTALVGPCSRIGAAAVTVVISLLLMGLSPLILGPMLQQGDGDPVVSGLPQAMRGTVSLLLRWWGN